MIKLDFQFDPGAQLHAAICRQTGFTPPDIHARRDHTQVDFAFSSSRQTFAKVQEASGLKPENKVGVLTDYQESLFRDPPMFRRSEPFVIQKKEDDVMGRLLGKKKDDIIGIKGLPWLR